MTQTGGVGGCHGLVPWCLTLALYPRPGCSSFLLLFFDATGLSRGEFTLLWLEAKREPSTGQARGIQVKEKRNTSSLGFLDEEREPTTGQARGIPAPTPIVSV